MLLLFCLTMSKLYVCVCVRAHACVCFTADDKEETFIKFLLSNFVSGMIIGSAGSTINKLMESTGTIIMFSPGRELYPGTNDRVCLITGSVPDICEAL